MLGIPTNARFEPRPSRMDRNQRIGRNDRGESVFAQDQFSLRKRR